MAPNYLSMTIKYQNLSLVKLKTNMSAVLKVLKQPCKRLCGYNYQTYYYNRYLKNNSFPIVWKFQGSSIFSKFLVQAILNFERAKKL